MIFVNTTFKGYYPVGTAAVVCAATQEEAADILNKRLEHLAMPQNEPVTPDQMEKFTMVPGNVVILADGNY